MIRSIRAIAIQHKIESAIIGRFDNAIHRHVELVASKPIENAEAAARRLAMKLKQRGFKRVKVSPFTDDSDTWSVTAFTGDISYQTKEKPSYVGHHVHFTQGRKRINVFLSNPSYKGEPLPLVNLSKKLLEKAIKVGSSAKK